MGRSLQTLRPYSAHEGDLLWLLRVLLGVTDARPEGAETLRGTLCRRYAAGIDVARAEAAGGVRLPTPSGVDSRQLPILMLTVWIDDQHIRRVRFDERISNDREPELGTARVSKLLTLELWDFGVPVRELNWSRLPDFQAQS